MTVAVGGGDKMVGGTMGKSSLSVDISLLVFNGEVGNWQIG